MKRLAVLAVTVGFSTAAFAGPPSRTQPSGLPPSETLPISYNTTTTTTTADDKSGATAVALSVGGLVGGFLIGMGTQNLGAATLGVMVGPSLGRWYNHEVGALGIVARTTGVVLVLNNFGTLEDSCEGWYSEEDCAAVERKQARAEKMILVGLGLMAVGSLYDFIQSGLG